MCVESSSHGRGLFRSALHSVLNSFVTCIMSREHSLVLCSVVAQFDGCITQAMGFVYKGHFAGNSHCTRVLFSIVAYLHCLEQCNTSALLMQMDVMRRWGRSLFTVPERSKNFWMRWHRLVQLNKSCIPSQRNIWNVFVQRRDPACHSRARHFQTTVHVRDCGFAFTLVNL